MQSLGLLKKTTELLCSPQNLKAVTEFLTLLWKENSSFTAILKIKHHQPVVCAKNTDLMPLFSAIFLKYVLDPDTKEWSWLLFVFFMVMVKTVTT